jgi:hypothetical protein
MEVGHINLGAAMNGAGEHFVKLVEGLCDLGVRQHVIVRNESLARRLKICDGVTASQTANTAVTAYCLMPQIALVHTHDETSGHAGLLLTLTRSIPYVASRQSEQPPGDNPIIRSVYSRAASLICPTKHAAAVVSGRGLGVPVDVIPEICCKDVEKTDRIVRQVAAAHLRVYRRAIDSRHIPALLL